MKLNFLPQFQRDIMADIAALQANPKYANIPVTVGAGTYTTPPSTATTPIANTPTKSSGNIWDTLNNSLGVATGLANIYAGIKTATPVQQVLNSANQQQPTIVYQQAPPATEKSNNTSLIIGIIAAVFVLILILVLVFKPKKGGTNATEK
jgi:hypothetical protein